MKSEKSEFLTASHGNVQFIVGEAVGSAAPYGIRSSLVTG